MYTRACVYMCVCECVHMCECACEHVHVCMCACVLMYTHVHVCVCMCVCMSMRAFFVHIPCYDAVTSKRGNRWSQITIWMGKISVMLL